MPSQTTDASQSPTSVALQRRRESSPFFATVSFDSLGPLIVLGDRLLRHYFEPPVGRAPSPYQGSSLIPKSCVLVQRLKGGLVYGIAKTPDLPPGVWDEVWVACDSGPSSSVAEKMESFRRSLSFARDDARLAIYQSKILAGQSIAEAAPFHPSGKPQPDVAFRGPTTIDVPITPNDHARGSHPIRAGSATEFWASFGYRVGTAQLPGTSRGERTESAHDETVVEVERPRQR